ncbi:unnamed protein product [Moneuplotes crassus]|uniref:Uncharacterized protein n=1 Tax=Euplotes crassus TaxID=5936 RepID=A0AAD2DA94_EUPCR|nr:unnamed protein product [Moneuplotes crassus]
MCFGCIESVVHVPGIWGYVILILNIILPGVGTIITSFMARTGFAKFQFVCGVFQLLLAITLIGWLWSVWWGCLIISKNDEEDDDRLERIL